MNTYKDKRWERKRLVILKRDDYKCRECRRYGKTKQANTVHHIYPLEQYPELYLVDDNLLSLCGSCHDLMHDRVNNTLTPLGMQWVLRVQDKVMKKDK